MTPLGPVDTVPHFAPLHAELVGLLRSLDAADWDRRTLAPRWRVRDVAAHLLDGDFRKLSGGRDRHVVARGPTASYGDIVSLIDRLNADGVSYAERLSPRLLTDLLEVTGAWVTDYVTALDPAAPAHISVAWAGEDRSANWMDTGREYTERWHHQMQIRDATGRAPLLDRRWLEPILDLSVRAFRRAYSGLDAPVGTAVGFEVTAEPDYTWTVTRAAGGWDVARGRHPAPQATVRTDADSAWKLLYNALSVELIRERVAVAGDAALAAPMLRSRSVMV